jgi:molybdopterin molybdotransferase
MHARSFQKDDRLEELIEVEEAQRRALEAATLVDAENIALDEAAFRVLREDVTSTVDVPMSDNSAMDGYAVRVADVAGASDSAPVPLRVASDVPAGVVPTARVEAGTAARIMTGAMLPEGADAVVPVEWTDGGSGTVLVYRDAKPGANVRRRGEEISAGDVVLRNGSVLGAGEVAVLATMRKRTVSVSRRPRVAILSTGSELVDVDSEPAAGKIVNSNSYALAALVRDIGGIAVPFGIVEDSREATVRAFTAAADCDFIISSGGVSVGAYDFVKGALADLGAETLVWRVAMKPGKPVLVSRLRERLFFGLPGNPVSCVVGFHLFAAPAIRKAMGIERTLPPVVRAKLQGDVRLKSDRRHYVRVRVSSEQGALVANPMRLQGSGMSTSLAGANGLAVFAPGARPNEGDQVDVVMIGLIQ